MRLVFATLILAALAFPANAQPAQPEGYAGVLFDRLHPEDRDLADGWRDDLASRIAQLSQTSDDPQTLELLPQFRSLIETDPLPFDISELEGTWRMRSLQATELGAFVYPYFPARIYPEGAALVFDKNSGSQRHRGLMAQLDENTVFFVGALYYGDEAPRLYSAMTAGEVTPAQREFDAVAEITKIGANHFLMAFASEQSGRFRFYDIRK